MFPSRYATGHLSYPSPRPAFRMPAHSSSQFTEDFIGRATMEAQRNILISMNQVATPTIHVPFLVGSWTKDALVVRYPSGRRRVELTIGARVEKLPFTVLQGLKHELRTFVSRLHAKGVVYPISAAHVFLENKSWGQKGFWLYLNNALGSIVRVSSSRMAEDDGDKRERTPAPPSTRYLMQNRIRICTRALGTSQRTAYPSRLYSTRSAQRCFARAARETAAAMAVLARHRSQ